MKLGITIVLFVSLGLMAGDIQAQESGIFGGRGIGVPSGMDESTIEPAKSRWPKMLDFSKDEATPASRKPFSELFKKKPTFDLFKSQSNDKPSFFKKPKPISEWFPKKDPSKPNLFQQMNAKSKNFFDRTTNWATQKNKNLKNKSNGTWDSIVNDFKQIEAEGRTTPAQPNLRTAEANGKPKVRF